MICPNCKTMLASNASFCSKCGMIFNVNNNESSLGSGPLYEQQDYNQMGSGPLSSNQPMGPQNFNQMGSEPLRSNQPMGSQNYNQMGSGPQNYNQNFQGYSNSTYTNPIQQNSKNSKTGLYALILSILGCTFFIGAILAIIDLTKKDGKDKTFSKIALGICGGWLLVGMVSNIFKDNDRSTKTVLETTTEMSTEAVIEDETENEQIAIEEKTTKEEITESITETQASEKIEKNGFDSSTKNTVEVNGAVLEIPDYFGEKSSESTDVLHYYYPESGGGDKIAMLMISSQDSDTNGNTFDHVIETYMNGATSKFEGYNKLEDKIIELNGYECYVCNFTYEIKGYNSNNVLYLLRDSDNTKLVSVFYGEAGNTEYTYFGDFKKIMDTIEITSSQTVSNENEDNEEIQSSSSDGSSGYDSLDLTTKNAYKAGINYLKFMGFSRQGLIDQLSSEYGDAYTLEQAQNAVAAIEADGKVDWKEQAVIKAKSYLNLMTFSRSGLIEQLTSEYGDQFTYEEAEYAADQVGLE